MRTAGLRPLRHSLVSCGSPHASDAVSTLMFETMKHVIWELFDFF